MDSQAIVSANGAKGMLFDYDHRQAGLAAKSGVVYDLLGIKGSRAYHVTYDGNGADGGKVPEDTNRYKSNASVHVLSAGTLSRAKYVFVGWNTKADGSGQIYQAEDTFTITGDTTLYAMWEERLNTVTFINDGRKYAVVKVENGKSIDQDDLTNESMPDAPSKEGYTFVGWNTQKDGNGIEFTGETVVHEDMTVYAMYKQNLTPDKKKENDKNKTTTPKTGDTGAPLLWIGASLFAFAALRLLRKRAI